MAKCVADILARNRAKILAFLDSFDCPAKGSPEEARFCKAKRQVAQIIMNLPAAMSSHSTCPSLSGAEQ